jgi:Protein of unknown function (DUF4058)
MPSPFPGMNPYLERSSVWKDFHDSFIPAIRDAISPQVRPRFVVKIEEHLYIHELSAEQRRLLGHTDASLSSNQRTGTAVPISEGTVGAPAQILPPGVEFERQPYLEIRDRDNRDLVTVIELLSPSNKHSGPDREQYLAKRGSLLRCNVHVVELDLLRGGPRLPFEEPLVCDYYVMISRAEDRPKAGIWKLRLRNPLPVIPIPLRAPWPDVLIDLQAILHSVYDRACYEDHVYQGAPQPALRSEDAEWADRLRALTATPTETTA